MKLKFNESCKDKYTGEYYDYGCTYEFDDVRGNEILATGKAVLVKDEVVKKVTEEVEVIEQIIKITKEDLQKLSKKELVEIAKDMKISTKGTKDELIKRIVEENDK